MLTTEERQRDTDALWLRLEEHNLATYGFRYVTPLPPPPKQYPTGPTETPQQRTARWTAQDEIRRQNEEQEDEAFNQRFRLWWAERKLSL